MIDWDGENIATIGPVMLPEVKEALKTGEYTYIDYTDIQTDKKIASTGSNLPKMILLGAVFAVGLFLVVRR